MKIKIKLAIITSLLGLCIILFTVLVANRVVIPGFVKVEDSRMVSNMERVNSALLDKMISMDATSRDYATWDSTYYAMSSGNESYNNTDYDSVDLAGVLAISKLDFIILMHNDGKIIFAKDMFSGTEQDYSAATADLQAKTVYSYFETNYAPIICHNKTEYFNGFIHLPDGVAIISSRPILKTDGTGSVQGTLIIGQMMDDSFVAKISNQTRISFIIIPYDSVSYEDKLKLNILFNNQDIKAYNTTDRNSFNAVVHSGNSDAYLMDSSNNTSALVQILHIDEQNISGNALLKDIFGKPIVLIEVFDNRAIYAEGQNSLRYIIQAILMAGILFVIAGYLLYNKFIISKLLTMEYQLRDIQSKKMPSARLTIVGNDELSSFGESVNRVLDVIEKITEEKQAVFDANPDTYFYVEDSWKIADYKITEELGDLVSKKTIKTLKNAYLTELFNSSTMQALSKAKAECIKKKQPVIIDLDISINDQKKIFEARIVAISNNTNDISTNRAKMFLILLGDITERKNFEQQLLDKNKDLEKFNKFAIDRELRMSDLKKEMRDLKNKKEKE